MSQISQCLKCSQNIPYRNPDGSFPGSTHITLLLLCRILSFFGAFFGCCTYRKLHLSTDFHERLKNPSLLLPLEHSFSSSSWFPSSQPSQLPGIIISGLHSEPTISGHGEKSCWGTNSHPCASTDLWELSQCTWGVPKSPGTAQLLQLAQSPGKTSIKGCPKFRTTAEKFKASPVSILQEGPGIRENIAEGKIYCKNPQDHWARN